MSDVIKQDELKEAVNGIGKAFEAFKETNDQKLREIESKGYSDPLTEEKLSKIEATLDSYEDFNKKATIN